VLERRAPPTFDVLIEIQSRDEFVIIPDITAAVDAFLRGYPLASELRTRDENGKVHSERITAVPTNTAITGMRVDKNGRELAANGPAASGAQQPERSRGAVRVSIPELAAAPARSRGNSAAPAVQDDDDDSSDVPVRAPLPVTKITRMAWRATD
jgi:hypothetical protein